MIDAHQHYWNPSRGDYGWMPPDDPVLSRLYAPVDLAKHLATTGVTQTVLVQAAPSIAETDYLLGIADAAPNVAKVVGWIEFEDPSQREVLARFAQHPKFAGVRPMIQDIENDTWMLRDDVQWAYEVLIELDLTFDCLGFPRHLPHFHNLLTRYPDLRAVIDHCMKPQVRAPSDENFATWSEGMSALAEDTNACCKLSGLVTEADDDWSDARLRPYTDHVIKAFGHDRVMWGSDWPVARLRCEYPDWHAQALRLISRFGDAAKLSVFNDTAQQFYRIT